MIQLFNIKKAFNVGKPNEFIAIEGISAVIDPQKVTALKGPSGPGKTTLLSLIGCMARPTAGRTMLHGREITSLPERFLTEIRLHTFCRYSPPRAAEQTSWYPCPSPHSGACSCK